MDLGIVNLITGVFLIVIGFLVRKYPNLIAGYNTMSEQQKKTVDIDGLSTFMRNALVTTGISTIVGYYLLRLFGLNMLASVSMVFVILFGVTIMVLIAPKFTDNRKATGKKGSKAWIYSLLGVITLSVAGLIMYGIKPSEAIITNDHIQVTGLHGLDLNTSNVKQIELLEAIPAIKSRTNGFSLGEIKKGAFDLEEYGISRLVIQSDKPPFLVLTDSDNRKIVLNYKDGVETKLVYDKIKKLVDR